jgi:hypothetical protein
MARDEATYLRQQERHAKGAIRRYLGQIQEDTTDCVREHPWWTVAACLVLGLVGGMVIGREALSKKSPAQDERKSEAKQEKSQEPSAGQRFLTETLAGLRSAIQQGMTAALVSRVVSFWSRDKRES